MEDKKTNKKPTQKDQLDLAFQTIEALTKTVSLYEQLNENLKKELEYKNNSKVSEKRSIYELFRSKFKNIMQDNEIFKNNTDSLEENEEINNELVKVEPILKKEVINISEPQFTQIETKPEHRTFIDENNKIAPLSSKPISLVADNNPYIHTNNNNVTQKRKEEMHNKFFKLGQVTKAKLNHFKNLLAEVIPHVDNRYQLETNHVAEQVKEESKTSKLSNLMYKLGFKLTQLTKKQKEIVPLVQQASIPFAAKSPFISIESAKDYFMFKGHRGAVTQAYKNAKDYFDVLGLKVEDLHKTDNSYLNNLKDVSVLTTETSQKLIKIGFDAEELSQGNLVFKSLDNESTKAKNEILEKMVIPQLSKELAKIFIFNQQILNVANSDNYVSKLKQIAQENGISYHSLTVALRTNESLVKEQIKGSDFLLANKEQIINAMDKYEIIMSSSLILKDAYSQSINNLKQSLDLESAKKLDETTFNIGGKVMKLSDMLKTNTNDTLVETITKIRERKVQETNVSEVSSKPKMST